MNPGWKLHWYEAVTVIGCGEKYLPLDELEAALRTARLEDTSLLTVVPASSSEARVAITTRARHGGAASSRLGDLLAAAAPRGWDWEGARVDARPRREGAARWPRLVIFPDRGEKVSTEAAKWLAERVLARGSADQHGELRELLLMCGLTVSAGQPDEAA